MPERDMDETINSDLPFEDAVKTVLDAGRIEDGAEDEDTE